MLDAITRLGYEPDAAARSIRTGHSRAAGFVVSDIGNPYFAAVCKGVESVLHEHGYSLLLVNSSGDPNRERAAIQSLRARRVDGLILSVAAEGAAAYLADVSRSVPTVLVDRAVDDAVADAVRSEHETGVRGSVEHLVSLGHRRIAILAAGLDQFGTRARIEAFATTARALGLGPDEATTHTGIIGRTAASSATRKLLQTEDRPTALVAASYDLLVAALESTHEMGLTIPGDISFVACEDFDVCRLHVPSLAVVSRNIFELGSRAASLLMDRLTDPGMLRKPVVVDLPTVFRPGESIGRPPAWGT